MYPSGGGHKWSKDTRYFLGLEKFQEILAILLTWGSIFLRPRSLAFQPPIEAVSIFARPNEPQTANKASEIKEIQGNAIGLGRRMFDLKDQIPKRHQDIHAGPRIERIET
ncbi:hypothetical protein DFH07DRAFT_763805 [Mycena maculata]|uniref:Uncharacterized protein n=1 Tax=Mycena maculata TaxID=230809 RepID=A0AAD7P226_9AGAR|nr:hypothetical protein DFH07DRAFT_763805 [Mycena maculata]